MTNQIEELKEKIATMQHNLKVLERLEASRTDVERAYRDAYGHYPETSGFAMGDWDATSWEAFQRGYEAAQKPKEFQPTPQTPEQVADGLRDAMKQAKKEGVFDEPKITDEVVNKMLKEWEENPPDFLKFEMGKTLEALITRWWCDVFGGINNDWDMETAIDDLVDQIQLWLPKEQSHEGTQDISVIDLVDGYNDALQKIKSKLRNKK